MAAITSGAASLARTHIDWKAGVWAGLIAGAVFLVVEMALVSLVMSESPWAPPRMMAAIILGEGVLPPPATFDGSIVAAAMVVHFGLSVVYGLIGAVLLQRVHYGGGLAIGALFGLVLYGVNFYLIAPAAFPWFEMARNGISVFAHMLFGAVLGLAYVGLRKPAVLAH